MAASESGSRGKMSLREMLYANRLYKNNNRQRFFNKKAGELGQIAFDDEFKDHMEKKYVGLANGAGTATTLNKLERENDIKRNSKNIANFLAQQANNVQETRHAGTTLKNPMMSNDFDLSSNRYKSVGRDSSRSRQQSVKSRKITAHSLATVPALLPMGNISAASSTVQVKIRDLDGTKSMTNASVTSSKRMLKIKGLRQADTKDRFNEDAQTETRSIRDSMAPKKRTLSYHMR